MIQLSLLLGLVICSTLLYWSVATLRDREYWYYVQFGGSDE